MRTDSLVKYEPSPSGSTQHNMRFLLEPSLTVHPRRKTSTMDGSSQSSTRYSAEADAVIEEQQESNSGVADIVDSTNNTQSSPERYCQITQYDSDQQQGTIEFLDSVESESTAFSLEDHINLRIKTNAKYIASVTEDADCARIAQLRRHGEYGPAITPVQGDIGNLRRCDCAAQPGHVWLCVAVSLGNSAVLAAMIYRGCRVSGSSCGR